MALKDKMHIPDRADAKTKRQSKPIGIILEFLALFAFWLILSGHYKAEFIIYGALAAGLVTFMTHDLVAFAFERVEKETGSIGASLSRVWHFMLYLPWLLYQIIMANIQVALIVLNPRMPVDPAFLQFRTRLRRSYAQVIVANSITLTPGTITVNLEDGKYIVHALEPSSAGAILDGSMPNRVGAFFLEEKAPAPEPHWAHSIEELES